MYKDVKGHQVKTSPCVLFSWDRNAWSFYSDSLHTRNQDRHHDSWLKYIYDIFHLLIFTSYIWNITVKTNRNLNSLKEGLQHSCASWFSASGVRLTMWSAGFLFPPPCHAARDHEFSKTNSFVSLIIGFRQSNSNLIIAAPQTQQKNSGSSEASHSLRCIVFQACPRPGRSEETLKNDNRAAQLLKQWTLKN